MLAVEGEALELRERRGEARRGVKLRTEVADSRRRGREERWWWKRGGAGLRLLLVHLLELLLVEARVIPLVELEVGDEAVEVASALLHVHRRAPHVGLLDLRRRRGVAKSAEVLVLLFGGKAREGVRIAARGWDSGEKVNELQRPLRLRYVPARCTGCSPLQLKIACRTERLVFLQEGPVVLCC